MKEKPLGNRLLDLVRPEDRINLRLSYLAQRLKLFKGLIWYVKKRNEPKLRTALYELRDLLDTLFNHQKVRGKTTNEGDDFIFESIIVPELNKDVNYNNRLLCKAHIMAARKFLDIIVKQKNLMNSSDAIVEFILDLKPVVDEINGVILGNEDHFFDGGKRYEQQNYEFIWQANSLIDCSITGQAKLDYRTIIDGVIVNIRKGIDTKMKKILCVQNIVKPGTIKDVRLPMDFYYSFIVDNMDLFDISHSRFDNVIKTLKWASIYIHNPIIPFIYVSKFITDYVKEFFIRSNPRNPNGNWSIYESIEILNLDELIKRFHNYCDTKLGSGKYAILPCEPEAIVR